MRRKGFLLALLSMAVLGLGAATGWVEDQRADVEVGWSPLYERRVTDALVPVTSQEARGAAAFATFTCDIIDTLACPPETSDCTTDCQ
ncbi:MAG: hypothetical protein ABFD77_02700, partial [Thermotogota bacterium]